jgi:signal transduction histidine kinase
LLGEFVRERQAAIIDGWTERARVYFSTKGLPGSPFLEQLPQILANLMDRTSPQPTGKPSTLPKKGGGRASTPLARGFDLDQAVIGCALLRRCILDLWEREVGSSMLILELKQLDSALDQSIAEAAARFAARRQRMLAALDRIWTASLGSSARDLFLQQLIQVAPEVSEVVDSLVVWLRHDDELRAHASLGVEHVRSSFKIGEGFAGTIAKDAVPHYLRSDGSGSLNTVNEGLAPKGTLALYGVPLVHEGSVLGVIHMGTLSAFEFSEEERLLLRTMANRATSTLVHAQLLAQRDGAQSDRKRLVFETNRAIRAREDLLSIVSHDLRNPLSVIVLTATQIARSAAARKAGSRMRRRTDGIRRAAAQMARLVDDLDDLSKIEAGKLLFVAKEPRDARQLLRQSVETFRPLARARKLTLTMELGRDRCRLFCDGDRIQQILSNLIGNAVKFTREGGTITARVRRSGAQVIFSVLDTGTGIPADQLAHVFEPYWQARLTRKGLGLGLSVAKAIVDAHGGRIWVESTVGRGSTFSFALPADLQRQAPPHSEEPHR